ncbi:MAG: hypothetical protein M0O96_03420 [Desulforhopalus sp.]|nr:hypothetical protein [Desulforhopalus sp.]
MLDAHVKSRGPECGPLKKNRQHPDILPMKNETDIKRAAGRKYRNPEFDRSGEISLRKVMEKNFLHDSFLTPDRAKTPENILLCHVCVELQSTQADLVKNLYP